MLKKTNNKKILQSTLRLARIDRKSEYWAKMQVTKVLSLIFLLLLPEVALAQRIPTPFAIAALSPLAVMMLAVILGIVVRSWRITIQHISLLVIWVMAFLFTAQHIDSDYKLYFICTPIVLYIAHTLLILTLLIVHIVKRFARS